MRRPSARARRAITWCLAVLFAAGLVGYLVHDARQRDYKSCLEANEGRAAIRQFAVAVVDQDGERTEGDDRTLVLLEQYLGPRDCEALR